MAVRTKTRYVALTAIAAVVLTPALTPVGASAGASAQSPSPSSTACPTPAHSGYLDSISAASSDEVWAVGELNRIPYAEHWDGNRWTGYPLPSPPGDVAYTAVHSVTARTASDAWAVGYFKLRGKHGFRTLTYHWNGRAWSWVKSPSPFPDVPMDLRGVDASAVDDAWAVGSRYLPEFGASQALALHWDGTRWSVAKTPTDDRHLRDLGDVTALSPSNAWSVGQVMTPLGGVSAVVEHWDGTRWDVVKGVKVPGHEWLSGIDAAGPHHLFAVGGRPNDTGNTLIEHGDGSAWSRVKSPSPGQAAFLVATSADASADAWAVGFVGYTGLGGLVEHWNGSRWALVDAPVPGEYGSLSGVAALSSRDVWAVGQYGSAADPGPNPDLEHWDGKGWTRYPAVLC